MTNQAGPDGRDHLLLIGGGHAHIAVLADWIRHGLPCERASLLTPHRHLRYSGTVPGWIAGQYGRDEGLVDVEALSRRAGAQFIKGRCTGIDPDGCIVQTDAGQPISFDIASIDTGGVGHASFSLGGDPRLIDIRPIERFVERLDQLGETRKLAVVGGGAGGVELAFALRNRFRTAARSEVTLVAGKAGLLPALSTAVQGNVRRALARQKIELVCEDARIEEGQLFAGHRSLEPTDLIVAALGSAAPAWAHASGLACDGNGFIAVDQHQRSVSHDHVFAVGDVAARQDREVAHSGVHAVMAGPILAENLRSVMAGGMPRRSYRPRWTNLYLISTADGGAIASYGPFSASGRWVSRLKHAIDMRWLTQYAKLTGEPR